MDKLFLILICLSAGALLRHFRIVPSTSHKTVNSLLVNVVMPALILYQISQLHFNRQYFFPVLVAYIIFGAAFLLFWALGKWKNYPPKTVAALIITAGISSTSFIGFPVFELLYGKQGLQIAILMSQAGSFLIGITLGVAVASWHSSAAPSVKEVARSIYRFPPFLAFVVALALNVFTVHLPATLYELLGVISSPFSVLALFAVGLQINFSGKDMEVQKLIVGLLYKLVLAPTIIFVLYHFLFRQNNFITAISVMGAAIGPMNTSAIIAGRYNLNANLASNMVAVGIPLSLPVLYFLHLFMQSLS